MSILFMKPFTLSSHSVRITSSLTNTQTITNTTQRIAGVVSRVRGQYRAESLKRVCIVQVPAELVHCTPRLTDFCFCLAVVRRKRRKRVVKNRHACQRTAVGRGLCRRQTGRALCEAKQAFSQETCGQIRKKEL